MLVELTQVDDATFSVPFSQLDVSFLLYHIVDKGKLPLWASFRILVRATAAIAMISYSGKRHSPPLPHEYRSAALN